MSDTNRTSRAPKSATPADRIVCPPWCIRKESCDGDHWSNPVDNPAWPGVVATGWADQGEPILCPHPVWSAADGLEPAVGLYLHDEDVDVTVDLRPGEARELAAQLVTAAAAVDGVEATTTNVAIRAAVARGQVDGGYSGDITITRAAGYGDMPEMVFVEAPLMNARLVLMTDEAAALGNALSAIGHAEAGANRQ